MARLKDIYQEKVVKQLTEQFGYGSVMQVPRISKITINMGIVHIYVPLQNRH